MELLIFSDSHGRYAHMREAYRRQVRTPDAVIFLGDGLRDLDASDFYGSALYAVQGNCDWMPRMADGTSVSDELLLHFEKYKILLSHGHRYAVKSGYEAILSRAVLVGADIVLFGHTHQPYMETIPTGSVIGDVTISHPIHLFNPGSVGQDGSFGTLSLRGENVLFSFGRI